MRRMWMVLWLSALPIAVLAVNPACQVTEEKARADYAAHLSGTYPDSYATQKMLLDSGMAAFATLCAIDSDPVSDGVLEKLNGRYYPNFLTIQMLYDSEMDAYQSLQRQ